MGIEIPQDLRPFVEQELKAGRFQSEQDLVSEALRMLQRERAEAMGEILAGLADVEAGRVHPIDDAFAELRTKLGLGETK